MPQPDIDEVRNVYKATDETYANGTVSLLGDGVYRIDPPVQGVTSMLYRTEKRKKYNSFTTNLKKVVKSGKLLTPLPYYNHWQITPYADRGLGWTRSVREADVYGKKVSYLYAQSSGVVGIFGTRPDDPLVAELLTTAETIAIEKLLTKAKDGKFNGAQAYAEAAQVERMIGDATTKIARVLTHLRKGQLKLAASVLGLDVSRPKARRFSQQHKRIKNDADIDRLLSNGVLQVQYGIRPLLNDVVGAAELLAQKVSGFHYSKVEGGSSLEGFRKTKAETVGAYARMINVSERKATVFVRYAVRFIQESESIHSLAQLGLTNPALLAWELLPWSFVIDWFIPIGNYLSTLDATLGLRILDGYKVVGIKTTCTTTSDLVPLNSRNYDLGHSIMFEEQKSFRRTNLSSWPSPKLPKFKNPVSWEHALNGVALLAGFRKTAYIR